MSWFTEGAKTNPTDGTILADTGALAGPGTKAPELFLSSTVGITMRFQQLDGSLGIVQEHQVVLSAGSNVFAPPASAIDITDQDRFRVITSGLIVGKAQASIFL